MRSIRVTGELQSLPADYKSWFFTATCGNGPSFRTPTSTDISGVAVDILFSSPSISEGEIKLELRGLRAEKEEEAGVLFATKTVKVPTNKSTHAVDLRLKQSAGDLVNTTAGFVFAWLPPSTHATDLTLLRTPHLAVTVSAAFSHSEACEDLSLRLLNSEGLCLACGSIPATGSSSTLLLLSEQHKDQSLELAVAGEAAGVFSIPQALEDPLVVQHCSEEGGKGSSLLVSTRMHVHTGNCTVGADQQGQSQLLSFGSLRLLPATGDRPFPPASMLVCYLETATGEHDCPPESSVLAGVVRGPLLSRLDLPPPSTPMRSGQYLLAGRSPPPTTAKDMATTLQELLEQCPNNLLYSKQLSSLSANGQMAVRLTILAVQVESAGGDDDAPCAHLVATCQLSEVSRSSATANNESSPPTDGTSDQSIAVLLRGVVESVAEVQDSPPLMSKGDTVELACAVLPVGEAVIKPVDDTPRVSTAVSLKSSHSVKLELEPAQLLDLSDQCSAQGQEGQPNELDPLHRKDEGPKLDNVSTGSEKQLIDVLTNELQEKQRLVDRLLSENNAKSRTIAEQTTCGDSLREEISKLKINLTETRAALSYREQESSAAVRLAEDGVDSPASLQQFSRPVLVQAVIECCNRLKQKDQECIDLKKVMGDSVSIRQQFIALTKTYKELQNAHLMQSNHIQKLHKQHEKVKTYQNTIVMQERVISKMQSVIESHLKATPSQQSVALPIREKVGSAGSSDKQRKSASLDDVSASELKQLRSKQSESESEVARMRAEISSKDIRIDALQEQLTISAAEASREIATLRTRLFELEIAGHGGSTVSGDFGGGDAISGRGDEMSASLSRDLLLVPFQESLQQDNDKLRREILSSRTKASRSSLGSQGSIGDNCGIPDRDQTKVLTSRSSRSREAPSSKHNVSDSFVDLSGTTHRDEGAPIRSKSISLVDAYRANSSGGSPRPRSPSAQSSGSSHASQSARDRSDGGHQQSQENLLQTSIGISNTNSRVSSKPNSRANSKPSSRIASPTGSVGRGGSPLVAASSVHEKDVTSNLLEF